MDATSHVLEITPLRREGGPSAKLAIGVTLFPQLFLLAVTVLLAVYFPFARFIVAVWVLWYAIVGVMVVRTLRRCRRGVVQTPTLWLTSDAWASRATAGLLSPALGPVSLQRCASLPP